MSEEGAAPAFGVKPEPRGDTEPDELTGAVLIEFAKRIRDEEDVRTSDRIYTGGDLVLTEVRKNTVSSHRIYRWEGQYDQWQAICDAPPMGLIARLS